MKNFPIPKFISSVVCLRAIVDIGTNTISLIDLLEEVQVDPAKLPPNKVLPINFHLVSFWEKEAIEDHIEGEVVINILSPKGEVLLESLVDMGFPDRLKRLRHIVKINSLKLDIEGSYKFRLSYKNQAGGIIEVGSSSIDVKFAKIG
jgi:hypothetical protein